MGRKEEAYVYLKEAIISNQLKPDQPLAELAISEQLHMSRTPIREAMRELEAEGLIVSYPARGSFVASLTPYDVDEIYALRVLLETWALERSIFRIPESVLDELEELFRTADSWEARHLADRRLHGTISEYAGSKRLLDFIQVLNSQVERVRRISATDHNRSLASHKEHLEILAQLRERDLPRCREALTRHLRGVADSAVEATRYIGTGGKEQT